MKYREDKIELDRNENFHLCLIYSAIGRVSVFHSNFRECTIIIYSYWINGATKGFAINIWLLVWVVFAFWVVVGHFHWGLTTLSYLFLIVS